MPLSLGLATKSVSVALVREAAHRITGITRRVDPLPSGPAVDSIQTTLTYDIADRVTRIRHVANHTPSGGSVVPLSTFDYTYTVAGDLSSYTGPEGTLNYTYDDTHQLTSASGARSEAYTYDANGNRTLAGYTTAADRLRQVSARPGVLLPSHATD